MSAGLLCVDRCAVFDEQGDGIRGAGFGARHERGLAGGDGGVRVSAAFEKSADESGARVGAGFGERGGFEVVGGVGVGAGFEEEVEGCGIVPVSEPEESGGAVGGAGVDVGLLGDEGADGLYVLLACGFDESGLGGLEDGRGEDRCGG
jgi:hypothetical protein